MRGVLDKYSCLIAPKAMPKISSVVRQINGTSASVIFDQPMTFNTGVTPNGNFKINGLTPTSVLTADATTIIASFGSAISIGNSYALTAQPNWAVTLVQTSAGLVS